MRRKFQPKDDDWGSDMEGFLSLEELSGDDIAEYESFLSLKSNEKSNSSKRKMANFTVSDNIDKSSVSKQLPSKPILSSKKNKEEHSKKAIREETQISDNTYVPLPSLSPTTVGLNNLPSESPWIQYKFHNIIQNQLVKDKFIEPTKIQFRVFERLYIQRQDNEPNIQRDIIGQAPTGSGKTLAFSLPIISSLLSEFSKNDSSSLSKLTENNAPISALILVPTRELGMQLHEHLYKYVENTSVRLVTLIGGIAVVKQRRQLSKRIDILIATPGRLWSFIKENGKSELSNKSSKIDNAESLSESKDISLKDRLCRLRWLVLDEVDRMIETGHFKEIFDIFKFIQENERQMNRHNSHGNTKRQTFVFSATMSAASTPSSKISKSTLSSDISLSKQQTILNEILKKVPFLDDPPLFIQVTDTPILTNAILKKDLNPIVSTVRETKILCEDQEKDLYLYHFLLKNPTESKLLFVNSIDCIRRLSPLLKNLGFGQVYAIHRQMEQRQRLSQLDKFKAAVSASSMEDLDNSTQSSPQGAIMIATDVLGRGIDIPDVTWILHYQLPRSREIYVHRAGRAGRGSNSHGCSVLFVSPKDWKSYHLIGKDSRILDFDLPAFQDQTYFSLLKERLSAAIQLDRLELDKRKMNVQKSWDAKVTEAFELDGSDTENIDQMEEYGLENNGNQNFGITKREAKSRDRQISLLKSQLKESLRSLVLPLKLPKGLSKKYITKNMDALKLILK